MNFNLTLPLCFDGDGDNEVAGLGGGFNILNYLGIVRGLSLFGVFINVGLNLGGKTLDAVTSDRFKTKRLAIERFHIFNLRAERLFGARRKG